MSYNVPNQISNQLAQVPYSGLVLYVDSNAPTPPLESQKGSALFPFPTLTEALAAAVDNTVLVVGPAVYNESITITKPITVQGIEGVQLSGDVIFDSPGVAISCEISKITCSSIQATDNTLLTIKFKDSVATTVLLDIDSPEVEFNNCHILGDCQIGPSFSIGDSIGSGSEIRILSTTISGVLISSSPVRIIDSVVSGDLYVPYLNSYSSVFSSNLWLLDAIESNLSASTIVSGTVTGVNQTLNLDDITQLNSTYVAATITIQSHLINTSNPHSVTKTQVGLGNVTDVEAVPLSTKGQPGGVPDLDQNSLVPDAQLPGTRVTTNAVTTVVQLASDGDLVAAITAAPDIITNPYTIQLAGTKELPVKHTVSSTLQLTRDCSKAGYFTIKGADSSVDYTTTGVTLMGTAGGVNFCVIPKASFPTWNEGDWYNAGTGQGALLAYVGHHASATTTDCGYYSYLTTGIQSCLANGTLNGAGTYWKLTTAGAYISSNVTGPESIRVQLHANIIEWAGGAVDFAVFNGSGGGYTSIENTAVVTVRAIRARSGHVKLINTTLLGSYVDCQALPGAYLNCTRLAFIGAATTALYMNNPSANALLTTCFFAKTGPTAQGAYGPAISITDNATLKLVSCSLARHADGTTGNTKIVIETNRYPNLFLHSNYFHSCILYGMLYARVYINTVSVNDQNIVTSVNGTVLIYGP
jgi:hypothetical protein